MSIIYSKQYIISSTYYNDYICNDKEHIWYIYLTCFVPLNSQMSSLICMNTHTAYIHVHIHSYTLNKYMLHCIQMKTIITLNFLAYYTRPYLTNEADVLLVLII